MPPKPPPPYPAMCEAIALKLKMDQTCERFYDEMRYADKRTSSSRLAKMATHLAIMSGIDWLLAADERVNKGHRRLLRQERFQLYLYVERHLYP